MEQNYPRGQILKESLEQGARLMVRWTQDGTLITPQQLSKAWGQDLQTLEAALERGDVFALWIEEALYFPEVFTTLGSDTTARICQALGDQAASSKLMFFRRKHGGIGGQTVLQALASGTPIDRIEELAIADTLD